jgi:hypothetical protein
MGAIYQVSLYQQHTRVIYGWVQHPNPTQSPEGTAESLLSLTGLKYWILDSTVHLCAFALAVQAFRSRFLKTIKCYSRPFKAIQGFLEKNYLFSCRAEALRRRVVAVPTILAGARPGYSGLFRPIPTYYNPLPHGRSADCPDKNPESIRGSKAFQAVPRRSKPFQAFFQKKKIVYFSGRDGECPSTQINPCRQINSLANQKPTETGQKTKSTVDLG